MTRWRRQAEPSAPERLPVPVLAPAPQCQHWHGDQRHRLPACRGSAGSSRQSQRRSSVVVCQSRSRSSAVVVVLQRRLKAPQRRRVWQRQCTCSSNLREGAFLARHPVQDARARSVLCKSRGDNLSESRGVRRRHARRDLLRGMRDVAVPNDSRRTARSPTKFAGSRAELADSQHLAASYWAQILSTVVLLSRRTTY